MLIIDRKHALQLKHTRNNKTYLHNKRNVEVRFNSSIVGPMPIFIITLHQ